MATPRKPDFGNVCRVAKPFSMGGTPLGRGDVVDISDPDWLLPRGRGQTLIEQRYLEPVTGTVTAHPAPPSPEPSVEVPDPIEVADEGVMVGANEGT